MAKNDVPVLRIKDPAVAKWLDPDGALQAAGLVHVPTLDKLKADIADRDVTIEDLQAELDNLEDRLENNSTVIRWCEALERAVKIGFRKTIPDLSTADIEANPWLKPLLKLYSPGS